MQSFNTVEKRPSILTRKRSSNSIQLKGLSQSAQQISVQNILRSTGAQAKLHIGQADDKYEKEADHVANRVMSMPESESVQRKCSCGGTCSKFQGTQKNDLLDKIQTKPRSLSESSNLTAPSSIAKTISSSGKPLSASSRKFFETRFNQDFSAVRVHTDAQAQLSAQEINARAYTLGHDLVFAQSQYNPETFTGRKLLAHELTHVVQQGKAGAGKKVQRAPFGIVLPTGLRFLDATERSILSGVYGSSLYYNKILLSNGLGGGGRPFTLYMSLPIIGGVTVIQIGAPAYNTPGSDARLLIHEAAHSWQSQHHSIPAAYMVNSIESQAAATIAGASAYCYITGKWFGLYGAEQIAEQAEDGIAAIRSHMRAASAGSVDLANVASLSVPRWEKSGDPGVQC